MNLKYEDKTIVLTGGTGGVGKHIALDFLKENATVVLLYRNETKFQNVKQWLAEEANIKNIDKKLFGIKTQIITPEDTRNAIKTIIDQHKKIDVLVNCAGFAIEAPLLLLEDEMIEQMIDVNFRSPLYLSKAVLRYMIRKKSGNIVNISSASTHAWGRGIVVYASAKAALERLTQTLAQEVGKKNIRINAVCPGVIDTSMSENLRSVAGDIIMTSTALKRYGQPKEIAKAVLFLASDEMASFITGVVLKVDGGFNL